jgi:hypothetical protein
MSPAITGSACRIQVWACAIRGEINISNNNSHAMAARMFLPCWVFMMWLGAEVGAD